MQGNLFVVSRVGQVRNVQTFITAFGATNNHLAVLYTAANPTLSEGIRSAIREELFSEVTFVEQPLRPVTQGRQKNAVIAAQIDELLRSAIDRGVSDVYLCNANAYYSLFERFIDHNGYPLSLNLLEEGLTTYAILGRRRYTRDLTASWLDVKRLGRKVLTNPAKLPYRLLAFTLGFASWLLRTDVVTLVKEFRVRLLVPANLRYGHVSHFRRAYVYFPDKVSSIHTSVDEVRLLPFALEPTVAPDRLEAVSDDSAIFVSQRYIAQACYLDIVLRIIHEMGLGGVVFKLHPREDPAEFQESVAQARKRYPGLDVQAPPEVQAIPAEELMMAGKATTVIGLTSTSLMYARAFFPGVRAISIAERFRELAQSAEYDITSRELSEFVRDLEVFVDVSGVEQFHPASGGPSGS